MDSQEAQHPHEHPTPPYTHTHLRFLQWSHAAAEHGAAVLADLQEEALVAAGVGIGWVQHQGQRRSVNDEAIFLLCCGPTPGRTHIQTYHITFCKDSDEKCVFIFYN